MAPSKPRPRSGLLGSTNRRDLGTATVHRIDATLPLNSSPPGPRRTRPASAPVTRTLPMTTLPSGHRVGEPAHSYHS